MSTSNAAGVALLVLLVAACTSVGSASQIPTADVVASSPIAAAPSPTDAPRTQSPPPAPLCEVGSGEMAVHIPSKANLFGAGLGVPPAPGGGGGGVLPTLVELSTEGSAVVTFPCVEGQTDCCGGQPATGPTGFTAQGTHVESTRAIAGLVMKDRSMFLAGVFLTDDPPMAPPPERLDLTGMTTFERYSPALGQTFYIGDGVGHSFVPPDNATRLYLGFVDAMVFRGEPGFYANNRGSLEASVRVTPD